MAVSVAIVLCNHPDVKRNDVLLLHIIVMDITIEITNIK